MGKEEQYAECVVLFPDLERDQENRFSIWQNASTTTGQVATETPGCKILPFESTIMVESVLDRLGEEVTGIVSPVSLCMALTVGLVRLLNPTGDATGSSVYIASAYYKEQGDDSTSDKITGSIINAAIFVGVIAVMTFLLVLLFKYGYTNIIYGYMAFAGFSIFFVLVGIIMLQLLVKFQIPLDAFSFSFMLYNFSVVGVIALFFAPAPILMKQGYLVTTGVVTAYTFTFIPEWTTWVMLVAMALYDLCAVLTPHGPLKVLVELAQERDEDIPALVYEARSTGQPRRLHRPQQRQQQEQQHNRHEQQESRGQDGDSPVAILQEVTVAQSSPRLVEQLQRGSCEPRLPARPPQAQTSGSGLPAQGSPPFAVGEGSTGGIIAQGVSGVPAESTQLAAQALAGLQPVAEPQAGAAAPGAVNIEEEQADETLLTNQGSTSGGPAEACPVTGPDQMQTPEILPQDIAQGQVRQEGGRQQTGRAHQDDASDSEQYLPDAIKLGLGDFIFYSVLVGRAAMYDMLTALVSYVAVMAGLGTTLLLLALYKKALPALPISVGLGVLFYVLARLLLEPFVLNLSTSLVFV